MTMAGPLAWEQGVGLSAPAVIATFGKYTLLRKLATGGMAEVFLARADGPMGFAKKCVVKRILPHFSDDQRFVDMFLAEARLAAQLSHPNLVQIFDFGEANGQYYLAMEYIDGPNLRTLNLAARKQLGPIPLALVAQIIASATEGLHFAHELRDDQGTFLNLVHRDISPDNILVSRSGTVKVVDFGIAKASSQPRLTKSGMVKGKMAYMAPEQLARDPLDRRADLFALGIVFYELVTGAMPFDSTSEISIIQAIMSLRPLDLVTMHRADCPRELERIVAKCLEKDRERRYATCVELQVDLEHFSRSSGTSAGSREISALVETLFPAQNDSAPAPTPQSALDSTAISKTPAGQASEGPAARAPTPISGISDTALRSVEAPAGQKFRAPVVVAGTLGLAGLAWAAWIALRPSPAAGPPVSIAVDAGTLGPKEDSGTLTETNDAGASQPEALDPPAQTVRVVDADAGLADDAAGQRPELAKTGRLELRIRPYATVYLDGRLLGDTPLPPIRVAVGKHKLRLVNTSLGQDIEIQTVVKPGDNVIKRNLKD